MSAARSKNTYLGVKYRRIAYGDPSSRRFFQAVILIAALDLVSFAFSGIRL